MSDTWTRITDPGTRSHKSLALLWIAPQFMAKRSVMTKFRKIDKVNYRQEGEIVNSPHSCTSLKCSIYRTSKDGEIDLTR